MVRFSPAKMEIVKITFHARRKRKVVRSLHDLGYLELIDLEMKSQRLQEAEEEIKARNLFGQVSRLIDFLNIEEDPNVEEKVTGRKTEKDELGDLVSEIEDFLKDIQPAADELRDHITILNQRKNELTLLLDISTQLKPLELDFGLLGEGSHFNVIVGQMKTVRLGRFEWQLKEATDGAYVFKSSKKDKEDSVLIVGALSHQWPIVSRTLTSFGFIEFKVPIKTTGDASNIAESTLKELEEIEKDFLVLEVKKANLAKDDHTLLLAYEEQLQLEKERLDAAGRFRKKKSFSELWAWIPVSRKEELEVTLKKLDETSSVEFSKPEKFSAEEFPTHLENNKYSDPFNQLVGAYGYPKYNEWDPTKFISLTFPLIFGIMFADAGHGFLLILMGLYGMRLPESVLRDPSTMLDELKGYLKKGGHILFFCGLTSTFFGLLFGSFFGVHGEHTAVFFGQEFPAIWFSPGATIDHGGYNGANVLLELAIFLGTLHILSALALQGINLIRHGEVKEAILMPFAFFAFYASFVTLLFTFGTDPTLWISQTGGTFDIKALSSVNLPTPLGFLGDFIRFPVPDIGLPTNIPMLIMLFSLLVVSTFLISHGMDGISELLDYLLTMISNTISYARIFAYNMVHGSLSVVIIQLIAGSEWSHGGITPLLILGILGNIVVIMSLETLVSFLQVLRLHWLEFFSKMGYKGEGHAFRPFRAVRQFTSPTSVTSG